jgi:H/ACA ribonucleoprotein complex subunit 3
MKVQINGKDFTVSPKDVIGKGGEADVYLLDKSTVLKIFKTASHPDLNGDPVAGQIAENKIKLYQNKLKDYPPNLPSQVIAPIALAYDKTRIVGYTMQFIDQGEVVRKYSDRRYRDKENLDNNYILTLFKKMRNIISKLHNSGIVIGDFNDLNLLVSTQHDVYFIDTDSYQFKNYLCPVFTEKFVDPILCKEKNNSLEMVIPHNENSDWFAFFIMLVNSMLYVDPFGGIYKPKDPKNKIAHSLRSLHGITFLNPEVMYPKPAIHFSKLPDSLLHYIEYVFEKKKREIFPEVLLDNIQWTVCVSCGESHARSVCPNCNIAKTVIKSTIQVKGTVKMEIIFRTTGRILYATVQDMKLYYVYFENGYNRETGKTLLMGKYDKDYKFRINNDSTLVGKSQKLFKITPGVSGFVTEPDLTDTYRNKFSVFDANSNFTYTLKNGVLFKKDNTDTVSSVGTLLENQTIFWCGPKFGFGFYQAGSLSQCFIFSDSLNVINDTIKIKLRGNLLDAISYFSDTLCWFFYSTEESGVTMNYCYVLDTKGNIIGADSIKNTEDHRLNYIRGKTAFSNFLFSATDKGLVQLKVDSGSIFINKEYSDTEPFLSYNSHIFLSKDGINIVETDRIKLLKIR